MPKDITIQSMTGYGRGVAEGQRFAIGIELKTVNGRFLDLKTKLPRNLTFLEPKIREELIKHLHRGVVEVFVSLQILDGSAITTVDRVQAAYYVSLLEEISQEMRIPNGITAAALLKIPGVIADDQKFSDDARKELLKLIKESLSEAITQLTTMRSDEGKRLWVVLDRELKNVKENLNWIYKHREDINESYFKKLSLRLGEWMNKSNIQLDEQRLHHEIAFYLDRSDITEELDRLASHIKQFENSLVGKGSVGKRLDFLIQELGREVNTIGSKCDDARISSHVVEMKMALEKIREQVQNLE